MILIRANKKGISFEQTFNSSSFHDIDEANKAYRELLCGEWDNVEWTEVPNSYPIDIIEEISGLVVLDKVVIPTFH